VRQRKHHRPRWRGTPPIRPEHAERRLHLDAISGWEAAILASIAGASGTLEERDAQIERSGFYGEYPAVLRAYLALLDDVGARLEAIKRALFIVWCGAVEPAPRCAIRELVERDVRTTFAALETVVRRGDGDDELRWMLAWYVELAPWLFEAYAAGPMLGHFLGDVAPDAWRAARPTAAALMNRGQMGQYWRSTVQGRLSRGSDPGV